MSILDITHERFVKAVNVANNTTLTLADVVFSRARENGSAIHPGDSLIRIKSRDDRKLIGSTICGYNRIKIPVIHAALGGVIACPAEAVTLAQIIPYLYINYGIRTSADEFVDASAVDAGEGNRKITLTAKVGSAFFTESAEFSLVNCPAEDVAIFYDGSAHTEDDGRSFAETYKWIMNATSEKAIVSTITTATVDFKALSEALTRLTGDQWEWESVAKYSLKGAVVRRAGLTDVLWGTNKSYAYAIVVELSSACTGLQGNLYIHFN